MSNSNSRRLIAERRARSEKQKRGKFALVIILLLTIGVGVFFAAQNRRNIAEKYAEIDPRKSKGDLDAPVLVVEYGDFQ